MERNKGAESRGSVGCQWPPLQEPLGITAAADLGARDVRNRQNWSNPSGNDSRGKTMTASVMPSIANVDAWLSPISIGSECKVIAQGRTSA